jgi:hypothetical protein
MSCIALGGTHLVDPVTGQLLARSGSRRIYEIECERSSEAAIQTAVSRFFPLTEVRFGCR